jgi:hypothetical protein
MVRFLRTIACQRPRSCLIVAISRHEFRDCARTEGRRQRGAKEKPLPLGPQCAACVPLVCADRRGQGGYPWRISGIRKGARRIGFAVPVQCECSAHLCTRARCALPDVLYSYGSGRCHTDPYFRLWTLSGLCRRPTDHTGVGLGGEPIKNPDQLRPRDRKRQRVTEGHMNDSRNAACAKTKSRDAI